MFCTSVLTGFIICVLHEVTYFCTMCLNLLQVLKSEFFILSILPCCGFLFLLRLYCTGDIISELTEPKYLNCDIICELLFYLIDDEKPNHEDAGQ